MDQKTFAKLARGDIVRQEAGDPRSYTIGGNCSGYVVAMADTIVRNPAEWLVDGENLDQVPVLMPGQAIENRQTGEDYIVTSIHGDLALAAKTIVVTEAEAAAWVLVVKPEFPVPPVVQISVAVQLEEASA